MNDFFCVIQITLSPGNHVDLEFIHKHEKKKHSPRDMICVYELRISN